MIKLKKKSELKQRKIKIEHQKQRGETDLNNNLVCDKRSRTKCAYKAKNVRRTNSTFDLLGSYNSSFRNWIPSELHGYMTVKKIWFCLVDQSLDSKIIIQSIGWE